MASECSGEIIGLGRRITKSRTAAIAVFSYFSAVNQLDYMVLTFLMCLVQRPVIMLRISELLL